MQLEINAKAKRFWRESTTCWVVEIEIQVGEEEGYYNLRTPWPACTRPEKSDVIDCLNKALSQVIGEL